MGCAMVARIPSHTAATGGGGGSGGAIGACFTRLVLVHLFICLFARAAAASAEPFPQRDRRAGNAQHTPYDMPQHNTTGTLATSYNGQHETQRNMLHARPHRARAAVRSRP
jgi:hypothetical protein